MFLLWGIRGMIMRAGLGRGIISGDGSDVVERGVGGVAMVMGWDNGFDDGVMEYEKAEAHDEAYHGSLRD